MTKLYGRRARSLLLWVCLGVVSAHAQIFNGTVANSMGQPVPGASVAICLSDPGSATPPCSDLATIYTNATFTTPATNPLTSDGLGNWRVFAQPGNYYAQIYGNRVTTYVMPFSVSIVAGGPTSFETLSVDSLKSSGCSGLRGWLEAQDCGAIGNGTADDSTALNTYFAAGAVSNAKMFANPGTYLGCNVSIAAGHVNFDGGYLTYGASNGVIFKPTTGCVTTLFTAPLNLFGIHMRGFEVNGSATLPTGMLFQRPINNSLRDVRFSNFPVGSVMYKQGGGLYSVFENNLFAATGLDLYAMDIQKAYATGTHAYSCNFCSWRDNEFYGHVRIGAGQGNLFEHNDIELTTTKAVVVDGTDSGVATGWQSSYNNNYFELTAGTAVGASVIKPQAVAIEVNGNEIMGPVRVNPSVSTTLGTNVTVGTTDTSVTVNPPDCTNIDTDHWYIVDAGAVNKRELIKPTSVTSGPCAVTAVFKFDHADTATVTHISIDPGSICIDLTNNTATDQSASIVSGNRIARCETGIKSDWTSTNGHYSRIWAGNSFETNTVAIPQSLPSLTFTQDKWSAAGGAFILDRMGAFLYRNGLHLSECTVLDTVLNLAQCNGFSMNIAAGTTLTGVQHAKPGVFWVHFPTAGVIVSNAGFNLCAGADYTVRANERLFFEVKSSTTPVVYELGQQTCIGSQADGTLLKVVSGKPTAAVAGTDYPLVLRFTHNTLDLASVAGNVCSADVTETATGADLGDMCNVTSTTAFESGGYTECRVSNTDEVKWQFCNHAGAPIDRASANYIIRVMR